MIDKYGLQLVTPPVSEPFQVSDLQTALRISDADLAGGNLAGYITAAREYVEEQTRRQLMTATWLMTLDQFPGRRVDEYRPPGWRYGIVRMPRAPLVNVASVQYIDVNQQLQTIPQYTPGSGPPNMITSQYYYQVSTIIEPGRVLPAPFTVWPVADPYSVEAVRITFTAGYASAALIPARILQAVQLLVGHLWEHREATIEQALACIPFGLQSFIRSGGYGEYV